MDKTCLLLFPFLLCLLLPASSYGPSSDIWSRPERVNQGRVYGGENADSGDYPFMASIRYRDFHFCGGSIIGPYFILTAAHCYQDPRLHGDIRIMVGLTTQHNNQVKDGLNRFFEIDKWIKHDEYRETPDHKGYLTGFDVALIKLRTPINFTAFGTANVAKICLPSWSDKPMIKDCVVIGWGWTNETHGHDVKTNDANYKLRSVEVSILKPRICLKYFPIKKLDDFICSNEFERGACGGDSGGPYICRLKGEEETWLQFGITSFGPKKCMDAPSVYTKVSVYSHWIVTNAARLMPPPTTQKPSTQGRVTPKRSKRALALRVSN